MKILRYPFREKDVRALRAGDEVSISGVLFTGRDKFHKAFADGCGVECDFRDAALYHCGPVVVRTGGGEWKVLAAGPTTSVRENPYEPAFIAASGVRVIIGKGGMDSRTLKALARCGAVYVQATGGAAALYAKAVKRVAGVMRLEEFGAAEACWRFEVEDFRGIVAMDSHGRSLFDAVRIGAKKALDRLF